MGCLERTRCHELSVISVGDDDIEVVTTWLDGRAIPCPDPSRASPLSWSIFLWFLKMKGTWALVSKAKTSQTRAELVVLWAYPWGAGKELLQTCSSLHGGSCRMDSCDIPLWLGLVMLHKGNAEEKLKNEALSFGILVGYFCAHPIPLIPAPCSQKESWDVHILPKFLLTPRDHCCSSFAVRGAWL